VNYRIDDRRRPQRRNARRPGAHGIGRRRLLLDHSSRFRSGRRKGLVIRLREGFVLLVVIVVVIEADGVVVDVVRVALAALFRRT
jgi:hypothetical protein